MSILLRRQEDDRPAFARKWENHGSLVKRLPYIRGYMQNHIVEDFSRDQPIEADGIVELLFEKSEDMTSAFSSPEALPVRADEPGFLGHGTGYVLSKPSPLVPATAGNKLFVITKAPDVSLLERILTVTAKEFAVSRSFRDDVLSVISRPEMARGPQSVVSFLHIYFRDAASASAAGALISGSMLDGSETRIGSVFRVRTLTVV
ncbi:MAG TPA: EthD family reductase [Terriglobales bacterium]|nr:EthD family reductase [Terriglobales bacterium]